MTWQPGVWEILEWDMGPTKEQPRLAKKQENISITTDKFKKKLQIVKNWIAPRQDGLQGYWIKHFHNEMKE